MAVGDQQRIAIMLLEEILGEKAMTNVNFWWLYNKHSKDEFGKYYNDIDNIFVKLGGDRAGLENKGKRALKPDCYFGGRYNFIFEFDELQHFTIYKLTALQNYPLDLNYGFNIEKYIKFCRRYSDEAIQKGPSGYRKSKEEFPFENGRAAQRAYLDAFRDILPTLHGLNPTIRISEFDVGFDLGTNDKSVQRLSYLLKEKNMLINDKN
jgi:hypothetical protein